MGLFDGLLMHAPEKRKSTGLSSGSRPRALKELKEQSPSPAVSRILSSKEDLKVIPGRIVHFRPDLVGEKLASKLCPAQLDTEDWIILVTPDYLNSDAVFTAKEI